MNVVRQKMMPFNVIYGCAFGQSFITFDYARHVLIVPSTRQTVIYPTVFLRMEKKEELSQSIGENKRVKNVFDTP